MLRDEQEDFTLVDEPDEKSLSTLEDFPNLTWERNRLITPEDVLRVVRLGFPTTRMDNIGPGEIFFLTPDLGAEKDLRDFSDLEG